MNTTATENATTQIEKLQRDLSIEQQRADNYRTKWQDDQAIFRQIHHLVSDHDSILASKLRGLIPRHLHTLFSPRVDNVKALCHRLHEGQTREDGQPYATHPIAVMELAVQDPDVRGKSPTLIECVAATALMHDVLEDTPTTSEQLHDYLMAAGFDNDEEAEAVVLAVNILSRPSKERPILSYLTDISHNFLANVVKKADLRHNLLNHRPSNRRDKYELCLHILDAGTL